VKKAAAFGGDVVVDALRPTLKESNGGDGEQSLQRFTS